MTETLTAVTEADEPPQETLRLITPNIICVDLCFQGKRVYQHR